MPRQTPSHGPVPTPAGGGGPGLKLWGIPALGLTLTLAAVGWVGSTPTPPCAGEPGCLGLEELRTGNVLDESYHLFDRDDRAMVDAGGGRRAWVSLERLPPEVPRAWIVVEDHRFREHDGVDLRGVARAAVSNLTRREVVQGASTIPMQLVRVLWPRSVQEMGRWRRKLLEARMAPRLVSELGRDRVLELYLNGIYLGDGIYGVGAAARHYFGVTPAELTTAQLATLVGMTKTPERFHPVRHPERARQRRDLALTILGREEVISPDRAARAREAPMEVRDSARVPHERTYITAAVRRELATVAPELGDREGLRIFTTVDAEAQERLGELMEEHLRRVEEGAMGPFLGDDQRAEGGAIALESSTGAVLALVGGRDFASSQLIRPLQSRRPVGSLTKPLLLAAALETGASSTRALSTDTLSVETPEGRWRPRDHVTEAHLLPHDMVALSSNRAAVRLGQQTGVRSFAALVRQVGVGGDIPPYPASFLGAFDASLAEMTAAFAALENGGRAVTPHLIRRVEGADGTTLWTAETPAPPVMSRETAHLVLDAMRDVVDHGTGWRVRTELAGNAAGKTGTTDQGADAWFVGVRPGLAAGVWVGLDQPAPITENASGGTLAAPLWGRWMRGMERLGFGRGAWEAPVGLVPVRLSMEVRGDSAVFCWGERGRRRLIRDHELHALPSCDAHRPASRRSFIPWKSSRLLEPGSVRLRSSPRDSVPGGGG